MTPDPRSDTPPIRVQIPAYTDAWMKGDRYGNVVKITRYREVSKGAGARAALLTRVPYSGDGSGVEIAHVLMDKSNKIRRVILYDCEVL
jgi:hypothetical protein